MSAFEVVVIILSIFLGIFLILSIAVLVGVINIAKRVRGTAEKAEEAFSNLSSISDVLRKSITPSVIGASLFKVAKSVYKTKKGKGKSHGKK